MSLIIKFIISCTALLAPPCLGPLSDAIDAQIIEYKSVSVDDTTVPTNALLFPPL